MPSQSPLLVFLLRHLAEAAPAQVVSSSHKTGQDIYMQEYPGFFLSTPANIFGFLSGYGLIQVSEIGI